jgi:hypothetical protein
MSMSVIDAPSSAHRLLVQSLHPEIQELEVLESDAELELRGTVPSWYLKQLAQETVRPAAGRRRIRNLLIVLK